MSGVAKEIEPRPQDEPVKNGPTGPTLSRRQFLIGAAGGLSPLIPDFSQSAEAAAINDVNLAGFFNDLRSSVIGKVRTIGQPNGVHSLEFRTPESRHKIMADETEIKMLKAMLDRSNKNADLLSLFYIAGPTIAGMFAAIRTGNIKLAIGGSLLGILGIGLRSSAANSTPDKLATPIKALATAVAAQTSSPTHTPTLSTPDIKVTVQSSNGNINARVTPTSSSNIPTPEPSATWTVTKLELPKLKETPWMSFVNDNLEKKEVGGNVNFREMYKIVGAVDNNHRKTVDLDFAGTKVAVMVDDDLKDIVNHQVIRKQMAEALNKDEELRAQIEEVSKLTQKDFAIVLDKPKTTVLYPSPKLQITQVVKVDGSKRYKVKGLDDSNRGVVLEQFAKPGERKMVEKDGKQESEFNLLPDLIVKGKDIFRADTNEVMQFGGVVVQTPITIDGSAKKKLPEALEFIDISKMWGGNLIRVIYATDLVNTFSGMQTLLSLVEYAEKRGMYIMLAPGSKADVHNVPLVPDDGMIDVVGKIAMAVKPYNNVILDVWNEPARDRFQEPDGIEQISNMVTKTFEVIREVNNNKNVIIGVPGVNASRDLRWINNFNFGNDTQLLLHAHDIPETTDRSSNRSTRELWKPLVLAGRYPVMLDEFNYASHKYPVDKTGKPDDAEAAKWLNESFDIIDRYNLSYTSFIMGLNNLRYTSTMNMLGMEGKMIEGAGRYPLEVKGQTIYARMKKRPPAQLDN